jgi:hypothetical protein
MNSREIRDVFKCLRFISIRGFKQFLQRPRALRSPSQSAEEALVVVLAFEAKCNILQPQAESDEIR